ncbi:chemotaxis protein CheW [uncultured Desulfosarcina sp.]|uniref:chemotaxis protein CheA n=1 Tax=uncultured Desulfosarcina sp. TaxID=218289 RepID=UPI0029C6D853|nr:chemotaxis protein CheW [uncultured Desulfosarcina sp.]
MKTASQPTEASVSINVSLLNSLMNLAGELVLCRNQLLQAINSNDRRLLETTGQHIDLVTSEIQEQIMRTRMQPMSCLFDKLALLVGDLAGKAGKQVELSFAGEKVEMDKIIMDAMEASMTQLIRNTVKYGIEAPEVRKERNKSEKGAVAISARHEAGHVVIDIVDDGTGIDPDAMVRRAVDKGLLAAQQDFEVTDESEKASLVFLPGLFDEEETGGFRRFAGLDTVKTDLEKVGGVIDVDTHPARGAKMRIKLPLTLSIIPSQIVRLGEDRFAVPQVNLDELLRIPADQVKYMIETVGGAEVIRLRGELLPVIDLAGALGIERSFVHPKDSQRYPERRLSIADRRSKNHCIPEPTYEGTEHREATDRRRHPDSALNIAVVSTGKIKYGLVVDAMHDSEEIVVKSLGRHLKGCRGFAGATIMGDGKVALILDVASIGEMAALHIGDRMNAVVEDKAANLATSAAAQSYLFFSNSQKERLAVPLDTVARIEKIDADAIETVGGSRVLAYRGGSLPLIALEDAICIDPLPEKDHYQVICFNVDGREIGLLAAPPVDAADVAVDLDTRTLKQSGVMGSAVLMDQTTLILDIQQVVRNARPEFFHEE